MNVARLGTAQVFQIWLHFCNVSMTGVEVLMWMFYLLVFTTFQNFKNICNYDLMIVIRYKKVQYLLHQKQFMHYNLVFEMI